MSEDCLNLSLWTPKLRDGAKRPVLVSFHGGGFGAGTGSLPLYDGGQLAVRGDLVVVSVSHRLNVLGFLDLTEFTASEDFKMSGAAGLLDLVAALRWVRENIEEFGGDPSNVTIIGQSGGGWKVSCLFAMPAAQGLFSRAIIQSGSLLRVKTKDEGAAVVTALLAELGLAKGDVATLQTLPWTTLLEASVKCGLHLFDPVLGAALPLQPEEAIMSGHAADVPVIVGTTLDDGAFLYPDHTLTFEAMRNIVEQRYGGHAGALLELYGRFRPGKSPYLLLGEIVTDAGFRRYANRQAELLAGVDRSPVYAYRWDWTTPGFSGVFGAAHGTDVAAAFQNLQDPLLGAGHPEGVKLARLFSHALINFARTGEPGSGEAAWPPFDASRRATMIFGQESGVADDPDAALRTFWNGMPMAATVYG